MFCFFLSEVMRSLHLNKKDMLQKVSLILTIALKGFCNFDQIERYFIDIDKSFTDTNSIESNEPAVLTKEI